jgi:predicted NBD/HSP70 family sugar kinase
VTSVLVIDVGGTHVKLLSTGQEVPRKIRSGLDLTPQAMVAKVQEATADWQYDAVSVGFPGPVRDGKLLLEPKNLGQGWVGYDLAAHFGKPVKLINDAAMQALGSYEGGRMLFLGLGTGLGSAFIIDGALAPLELAHLPYKKGCTFEDYVGLRGLNRLGKDKWREAVSDVATRLQAAFVADYVVLGGGNVKKLKHLPPGCRAGSNSNAFVGGFRLWEPRVHTPPG